MPTFLISPLMERGEEMALRVSIREGWTTQPYTRVGDVPNPQRNINMGCARQSRYPKKELQSRGVSCKPPNVVKVCVEVRL